MKENVALLYKPESRGFDSTMALLGFFFLLNSSGHSMALGYTEPVTEMYAGDISWGVKAVGA